MQSAVLNHWYLGVLLILALILLKAIKDPLKTIRNKVRSFRLKVLLHISNHLEPDAISAFRLAASKTFAEIGDFLEKSELELFRTRIDNVFLKDKIQEIERNQKALIQELGGPPDFLSIEFSVWAKLLHTLNFLQEERSSLLKELSIIDFYQQDSNLDLEKLIKNVYSLQEQNENLDKELNGLSDSNRTLKLQNKNLIEESDNAKSELLYLTGVSKEIQTLRVSNSKLKEEVDKLKVSEVNLQLRLTRFQLNLNDSNQQNQQLKKQINQLSSDIATLTAKNQDLTQENIRLQTIDKEKAGKPQTTSQNAQSASAVESLESYRQIFYDDLLSDDSLRRANRKLSRKVTQLCKELHQVYEQLG